MGLEVSTMKQLRALCRQPSAHKGWMFHFQVPFAGLCQEPINLFTSQSRVSSFLRGKHPEDPSCIRAPCLLADLLSREHIPVLCSPASSTQGSLEMGPWQLGPVPAML